MSETTMPAAAAAAQVDSSSTCWNRGAGCRKTGLYEPVVRVWPRKWMSDKKSANFQMCGMAYCGDCRDAAKPLDIMGEKMRSQVDATFKADGKPMPDWSTVQVVWSELQAKGDVLEMPAVEGPAS